MFAGHEKCKSFIREVHASLLVKKFTITGFDRRMISTKESGGSPSENGKLGKIFDVQPPGLGYDTTHELRKMSSKLTLLY